MGKDSGITTDKIALQCLFLMQRIGPLGNDGLPQTWAELVAFSNAVDLTDGPADVELLHDMCDSYYAGLLIGRNVLGIPPCEGAENERRGNAKARR
jgi:hypothetical protein